MLRIDCHKKKKVVSKMNENVVWDPGIWFESLINQSDLTRQPLTQNKITATTQSCGFKNIAARLVTLSRTTKSYPSCNKLVSRKLQKKLLG